MSLNFDSVPIKVQDLTPEVNAVGNIFKTKALDLMSRFDFESTTSKSKCKHYPLDYLAENTVEGKAKALELISSACWATFQHQLEKAVERKGDCLTLEEHAWDQRGDTNPIKIGKVWMCAANRFSTINTEVEEPQVFAFGYLSEDGYEVQGEINFGVEVY